MDYETLIESIHSVNAEQGINLASLPHCSNLLYQLGKRDASKLPYFITCCNTYLKMREPCINIADIYGYVNNVTKVTNAYLDFFWPKTNNPFSHQADFTSSILPEMLCILFNSIITLNKVDLEVSAQKDLIIESIFNVSNGGTIRFKYKKVDVSVTRPSTLMFNGTCSDMPIPLVAVECKTNLDKNMISGIEHSVSELKKSFPDCYYYVVSEVSDFDIMKSNYASSDIDEIFILRNQKRATIRRDPTQRNPINSILVYEIVMKLMTSIKLLNDVALSIETKMQKGKLIGRTHSWQK